ncbi:hypothetical protein Bca52824_026834 [Brassica carinata]|uniref:Uncharacterized protein n=1 Tax=Brassica carinata TaxID=52824 RepID=A0A8X7VAD1_BRACI|nr:hypothetical protein Bca52824_026834 [Brassica carinata]
MGRKSEAEIEAEKQKLAARHTAQFGKVLGSQPGSEEERRQQALAMLGKAKKDGKRVVADNSEADGAHKQAKRDGKRTAVGDSVTDGANKQAPPKRAKAPRNSSSIRYGAAARPSRDYAARLASPAAAAAGEAGAGGQFAADGAAGARPAQGPAAVRWSLQATGAAGARPSARIGAAGARPARVSAAGRASLLPPLPPLAACLLPPAPGSRVPLARPVRCLCRQSVPPLKSGAAGAKKLRPAEPLQVMRRARPAPPPAAAPGARPVPLAPGQPAYRPGKVMRSAAGARPEGRCLPPGARPVVRFAAAGRLGGLPSALLAAASRVKAAFIASGAEGLRRRQAGCCRYVAGARACHDARPAAAAA